MNETRQDIIVKEVARIARIEGWNEAIDAVLNQLATEPMTRTKYQREMRIQALRKQPSQESV